MMARADARIVFAGSPEFAVPSLRSLIESGYDVVAVLTQPDRPAGRGRRLQPVAVKEFAAGAGLDVLQPQNLSAADIQHKLRSMSPDLMIVVAYGLLLPVAVLEIPRAGCINVHASRLPRWRGASPVQAAILAGDPISGVSIMRMEQGLDTGPVYAIEDIRIGEHETAGQLHDRLAQAGAHMLVRALEGILDGSSIPRAQSAADATYAGRISKADAAIDWTRSAVTIDRQIRAYNPWPVAETRLDGLRLRCWFAELAGAHGSDAAPGECVSAGPDGVDIQTGDKVLRLKELQLPGGQRMDAGEFVRGHPVLGKTLG